jgi:hypothetical protein
VGSRDQRPATLAAAQARHPQRFTTTPQPPKLPTAVWINQPEPEGVTTQKNQKPAVSNTLTLTGSARAGSIELAIGEAAPGRRIRLGQAFFGRTGAIRVSAIRSLRPTVGWEDARIFAPGGESVPGAWCRAWQAAGLAARAVESRSGSLGRPGGPTRARVDLRRSDWGPR